MEFLDTKQHVGDADLDVHDVFEGEIHARATIDINNRSSSRADGGRNACVHNVLRDKKYSTASLRTGY